jgi:hypothetical protein
MVKPELKQRRQDAFDKNLRSEFTREDGGARVKGIVPEGGHIVSLYEEETCPVLTSPGTEFYFRVDRCHLSEGWNDYHHAMCEEAPVPLT